MKFGEAVELMRDGKRITRKAWGNKFWICYVDPENYAIRNLELSEEDQSELCLDGFIGIRTANLLFMPYQVTNKDIFAMDWELFTGSAE